MEMALGVLIGIGIAAFAVYLSERRELRIKGDPEVQKRIDKQWNESINLERQRLNLQAEQLKANKTTNELLKKLIDKS